MSVLYEVTSPRQKRHPVSAGFSISANRRFFFGMVALGQALLRFGCGVSSMSKLHAKSDIDGLGLDSSSQSLGSSITVLAL